MTFSHDFIHNVNMLEEILVHEAMIALRVFHGEIHILIHVKGYNVLEGDATFLVGFNQLLVHTNRRRTSRESFLLQKGNEPYQEQKASPELD